MTLGDLFTRIAAYSGLEIYSFRTYPAEIRGGQVIYQTRLGTHRIMTEGDEAHVLVAMNQQAWVEEHHAGARAPARKVEKPDELPEVDLRHLRNLTDDVGILQRSIYATPDRRHGYSTDDNARALIVSAMYWGLTADRDAEPLMHTYLSFLAHSMDEQTGRFRHYLTYDRQWSEGFGSEDSHARALWGLGNAIAMCPHESMIALATRLFLQGLPVVENFSSPRAWAFVVVGIHAYLARFGGDSEARRFRATLVDRLSRKFAQHVRDDWRWCEDVVTYANAKLPHALLMSGKWMNRNELIDMGKTALQWLLDVQTGEDGMLSIIGTDGWYVRGSDKARFDQQPVEAHALVDACIEAYHVTRETHWIGEARKAFHWFLGDNDLRIPLFDFTTGGCRDGLHADSVNQNQGAESTLAWLMSLLLMHELQMEQTLPEAPADKALERRPLSRPIQPSGPVVGAKVKHNAGTDRDGQ